MQTESEILLDKIITQMGDYSATELAEKAGIGVKTVRQIKSCDRVPSINTLSAIERAMMTSTTESRDASRFAQLCKDNGVTESNARKVMTQQALKRKQADLPAYSEADALIEAVGLIKFRKWGEGLLDA